MNSRDPLMNNHDKRNVHRQKFNSDLIPYIIADISIKAFCGSKIVANRVKNSLTPEMLTVYKVNDAF